MKFILPVGKRPDRDDEESYNTYDQITERLVPYVKEMGFTHVELMPVMEHPFDGSWGYQCTGFFAATSRFGDPQGLMRMVDAFHKEGSALFSIGCLHTFLMMHMACLCLMAHILTSMQICAKDFIRIGTVIFSIIKGEK
jgi:hypothetical protein